MTRFLVCVNMFGALVNMFFAIKSLIEGNYTMAAISWFAMSFCATVAWGISND